MQITAFFIASLIAAVSAVPSVAPGAVDTNAAPSYGSAPAPGTTTSSPLPVVGGYGQPAPTTASAQCGAPQSPCPTGLTYGAVLYEQTGFSGIKHWVDGTDGECRGLNGTSVDSIKILASAGGDAIYSQATEDFAKGVTLTFFSDFGCGGSQIQAVDGTTSSVVAANTPCIKPKSVKITCNGKGSGVPTIQPPSARMSATLFEERSFTGIKHWVDGVDGECRGLNGTDLASVQYVTSPGADPISNKLDDATASASLLVFFDGFGCIGNAIGFVHGSSADTCNTATGACGVQPKSVMFRLAANAADILTPSGSAGNGSAATASALTGSTGSAAMSVQSGASANAVKGMFIAVAIATVFLF